MGRREKGSPIWGYVLKNPDVVVGTLWNFLRIGCLIMFIALMCSLLWFVLMMAVGVNM